MEEALAVGPDQGDGEDDGDNGGSDDDSSNDVGDMDGNKGGYDENVIIHCREEGCIGKSAPPGNLHPEAREIARGQSRGQRCANWRGGRFFQIIPTRGSVLPFFFPERKCLGNYPSNSRGVLTVYKFNTLPLFKKE